MYMYQHNDITVIFESRDQQAVKLTTCAPTQHLHSRLHHVPTHATNRMAPTLIWIMHCASSYGDVVRCNAYRTRANRVPGALFFKLSLWGGGDTIQEGALFKRGLYYFNHPPSKANQIFSSFLTVPSILKSN